MNNGARLCASARLCRGSPVVILICHDDLSESTYLLLTVSCIAVFIIAVHAFPFRVASMSAVR